MKKNIILLILFIASNYILGQAKIEFSDPDNTIDYGTVTKETDNGLRTFVFKNIGNAPLIINNVVSTCGCTVPSKPTEPIMPGKTGKIEIKYNMSPGPIRKTVTVETNATNYEGGKVALKIKGTVVSPEQVNVMEKKKSLMSN